MVLRILEVPLLLTFICSKKSFKETHKKQTFELHKLLVSDLKVGKRVDVAECTIPYMGTGQASYSKFFVGGGWMYNAKYLLVHDKY